MLYYMRSQTKGSDGTRNQEIRDLLNEMLDEATYVFDNPSYDSAIIGVSDDGRVIYDHQMMIQSLMQEDGISVEEAADFISYNSIRAAAYIPNGPIVMYGIKFNQKNFQKGIDKYKKV